MKNFVTGGTSSIGRVLVKALARDGESVRVLVRPASDRADLQLPGVEFVAGDVTDGGTVREGMAGCSRVFHLAAVVGQSVEEVDWWRVNVQGTREVLDAAAALGVARMVQVSSISVLGHTGPDEVADETRLIEPVRHKNLYQKTKYAADQLARSHAARGLPVAIAYPGFGFGHSHAASHPSFHEMSLLRLAAGKPVAILGSGRNRLCFAYYQDTVRGIRLAAERGATGEGYVLGNENLTLPQAWAAIGRVLGKAPPRRRVPAWLLAGVARLSRAITGRSPFPPDLLDMLQLDWCFSTAKARRELGWRPLSFEAAMAETWADYSLHAHAARSQAVDSPR